jgi:hypothetical protein
MYTGDGQRVLGLVVWIGGAAPGTFVVNPRIVPDKGNSEVRAGGDGKQ